MNDWFSDWFSRSFSDWMATITQCQEEKTRPSIMFCVGMYQDKESGQWIAYHGDLRGSGKTPNEACKDFDNKFWGREVRK